MQFKQKGLQTSKKGEHQASIRHYLYTAFVLIKSYFDIL